MLDDGGREIYASVKAEDDSAEEVNGTEVPKIICDGGKG
jgi:hypothetical protein